MHLSFITSLARQGDFPPDYSLLPGHPLCYPFLGDSVSASLLLCGAPLTFSYALPMWFAMGQVMAAFLCVSIQKSDEIVYLCVADFHIRFLLIDL